MLWRKLDGAAEGGGGPFARRGAAWRVSPDDASQPPSLAGHPPCCHVRTSRRAPSREGFALRAQPTLSRAGFTLRPCLPDAVTWGLRSPRLPGRAWRPMARSGVQTMVATRYSRSSHPGPSTTAARRHPCVCPPAQASSAGICAAPGTEADQSGRGPDTRQLVSQAVPLACPPDPLHFALRLPGRQCAG